MSLAARADFICEWCHAKGKMPEPVELPVASRKCPLCGRAKHLQRIWSGYSVAVAVRSQGEALPRMSHENIKRIDAIVRPSLEQRDAQKRFPVGMSGYEVKAVGMGNVGAEVGKLAGLAGGEQAARMTAASVQGSINKSAGRSDVKQGQVRAMTPAETMTTPPSQRINVVGKWTPSQKEIMEAKKA